MTPLPTLRQLQFFMALVRRQSFSKAAKECLVSQSTLSSAIKEIEGLLNQQLVDRSTRQFALTPTGELVAARAATIIATTEDMLCAARNRSPLDGPFYLGVIPTIAPFMIPTVAANLRQVYPKLKLFLREDLTSALVEQLAAGLIDAALLAFPYDISGVEINELGGDPFWFACDPHHVLAKRKTVTTDDMKGHEILLLEDGHCLKDHAVDACHLAERNHAAAYGGTSLFTLTQMTRAGLGATLLPQMAIQEGLADSSGLIAIPFDKPQPSRKIGLVWRKGSGRSDDARAISDIMKQYFD